ncbi:MAG: glucose 1-dehydrogenase [Richelia sp. RM1_1_1]|nr:glucose 1-dehydrogenase [Richelia sp. RM1_1_1]
MDDPKLLNGKITIVTGGGSGIGRASAILFAQHGSHVVIASRRVGKGEETVSEIRQNGGTADFIQTDISDERQVQDLIQQTLNKYKKIDCAFNCAGYDGKRRPITEMTLCEWDRIIETNLRGSFLLLKYEIEAMLENSTGTIVNMGSISGKIGRPGRGAYNASRAAIINLTKTAAIEYIKKGIRINAVGPGPTRTDIFSNMTDGLEPSKVKKYEALHPIGRICEPFEVAEAALWLLSEKSSFVVGHTLMVDGGLSATVAS